MHDDQGSPLRFKHIDILIEEYRALYDLLAFRLAAIEKRVPITGAALYALLGSVPALEPLARTLVLLVMPPAAVWFLRTTMSHARAKHDVKLRLIAIENHVNDLAGDDLLTFQSAHPSRGREVAGRSGQESFLTVYFGALGLLAACAFIVAVVGIESVPPVIYFGALGASAATLTYDMLFIRAYRSDQAKSPARSR